MGGKQRRGGAQGKEAGARWGKLKVYRAAGERRHIVEITLQDNYTSSSA